MKEEEEDEADDSDSAAESVELNHEGGPDPVLEHLSTVDDFGLDSGLPDSPRCHQGAWKRWCTRNKKKQIVSQGQLMFPRGKPHR